jgi:hypothetical protein
MTWTMLLVIVATLGLILWGAEKYLERQDNREQERLRHEARVAAAKAVAEAKVRESVRARVRIIKKDTPNG